LIQDGLALGQRVQTPNAFLLFTVQLFALRREQGRLQELEDASKSLTERFPAIPGLRTGLAFLYSELEREKEARAEFDQVASKNFTDVVRDQGWLGSMTNLAQVACFLKDTERANTLYELLLPYAERTVIVGSANDCFGAVARYLGLLATTLERWDEAVHHFETALAINTRVGARLFVAHTQHDYASMLLTRSAQGDREHALVLLDQAFATAQELGMQRLEEKVKRQKANVAHQKVEQNGQGSTVKVQHTEESSQYAVVSSQHGKESSQFSVVRNQYEVLSASTPQTPNSELRTPNSERPNLLRQEGDYWTVGYDGTVVRLQDAKGLAHLACLLREPQREFHVLDLLAMTDGLPSEGSDTGKHETQVLQLHPTTEFSDARALPDRQAITVYQQRVQDLREELTEAERFNDSGRISSLRSEIDYLTTELAAAYGTATHTRKRNDDTEKVRKTITHRIRTVLTKIKKVHPSLWRHLYASLKTGTFCSYTPEKPTDWDL
jgi:tetratricopeptide (TPR) repeat protein